MESADPIEGAVAVANNEKASTRQSMPRRIRDASDFDRNTRDRKEIVVGMGSARIVLSEREACQSVDCYQICVMLWDMKKKKVDPLAYAAKVRKDADRMQAMSEAFGTHQKLAPAKTSRTGTRKDKKTST